MKGLKPQTRSSSDDSDERRPVRVRRKPAWMNSDDWVVSQHTFNVQPHQVVYILILGLDLFVRLQFLAEDSFSWFFTFFSLYRCCRCLEVVF